jgi:hypothetical protein
MKTGTKTTKMKTTKMKTGIKKTKMIGGKIAVQSS